MSRKIKALQYLNWFSGLSPEQRRLARELGIMDSVQRAMTAWLLTNDRKSEAHIEAYLNECAEQFRFLR